MNMMCTVPLLPAPSQYAPTAKSSTPSELRSPIFAIDRPKRSSLANSGPFVVESLISTVDFTAPSEVVTSVNLMVSDND